jgi:hypothetical protein
VNIGIDFDSIFVKSKSRYKVEQSRESNGAYEAKREDSCEKLYACNFMMKSLNYTKYNMIMNVVHVRKRKTVLLLLDESIKSII